MEKRFANRIKTFLVAGKASASIPHFTISQEIQDELVDDIASLLKQAQGIGVQHGQVMAGKHERGLVSGIKNVVSWAKDIVSGIMDRINEAIDAALGSDDEEGLSEADIVDTTMNDLIGQMPDLIAETEIQDAVESAVIDTIRKAGVPKMRWVADPDACPICQELADQGPIDTDSEWSGGITSPPAHPRCRCSVATVLD